MRGGRPLACSDRRGPGRPRRSDPVVPRTVKLPQDAFDAYSQQALAERRSVHALLVETLRDHRPK